VENIYEGATIEKTQYLCISHVQTRELKKKNKGLGRKGKLTKTIIDKLQNYFRIAIKSNKGVLEGMK